MKAFCQIKGMQNETLMRRVQLNVTSVKHPFFKIKRNSCTMTSNKILLITNMMSVLARLSFLLN